MQLVTAANADAADECYAHHCERATPIVILNGMMFANCSVTMSRLGVSPGW